MLCFFFHTAPVYRLQHALGYSHIDGGMLREVAASASGVSPDVLFRYSPSVFMGRVVVLHFKHVKYTDDSSIQRSAGGGIFLDLQNAPREQRITPSAFRKSASQILPLLG